MFNNQIIAGAAGQGGGSFYSYSIDQSLRFDGTTSNLARTHTAGDRQKFTWSGWVKYTNNKIFSCFEAFSNGTNFTQLVINTTGRPGLYHIASAVDYGGDTVFRLRDPSAWYHIVWRVDTTQANAGDRVRVYVNGELPETNPFTNYGSIPQNTNTFINSARTHRMLYNQNVGGGGAPSGQANAFGNGYLSEVHFCDGQSYAPTEFGETINGIWVAKEPSVTYGTNGFHLAFSDTSAIGDDTSGQNNDWTANNLAASDVVSDSPTNNFPVLNPLDQNTGTLSEGNLKVATVSTSSTPNTRATFAVNSGKWYWEYRISDSQPHHFIGIVKSNKYGTIANDYITLGGNGANIYADGSVSQSSLTPTFANGKVIGIALDADAETVQFYLEGTAHGTAESYASFMSGEYVAPWFIDGASSIVCTGVANFGQDSTFAGTETAGGNSDGEGIGDFAFPVPSGFLALCSANLPEPTIGSNSAEQADDYFNTVLYTGNGSSSRGVTGVNFAPDWVWIKQRNGTNTHQLLDVVRGKIGAAASFARLRTDTTAVEATPGTDLGLLSLDSDGFTLGSDGAYNASSNTYVAWNWKAGGTAPTQTYTVKVVADSGNKYRFDDFGTSAVTLELQEGGTYTFDQSDSSNSGHPLRFSTTSDGTHNSGSEYTTGVTATGTPGSSGASTTITVASGAPTLYYYCSVHSGMGGQADTGTGGSSNFEGSLQSVVSAAPDAGFSIATWTGTGSAGATVGHGLGAVPDVMIVKKRAGGTAYGWAVWHKDANDNSTDFLQLNSAAAQSDQDMWNDTDPTSTVLSLGANNYTNYPSGATYVGYFFKGIDGYSKFSSFVGNGSTDGTFVYTGFRPAWLMVKRTNASGGWHMFDNKRAFAGNEIDVRIEADNADAENTSGPPHMDLLSNGFKIRTSFDNMNASGSTYIYLAFAEAPFKYANAR